MYVDVQRIRNQHRLAVDTTAQPHDGVRALGLRQFVNVAPFTNGAWADFDHVGVRFNPLG
jgi:hypothetical protein